MQRKRNRVRALLASGLFLGASHCGAPDTPSDAGVLVVRAQSAETFSARFAQGSRSIDIAARPASDWVGDVEIASGTLTYDFHYDFDAHQVTTDAHGAGFDRETARVLHAALGAVSDRLAPQGRGGDVLALPLHEQMSYAALASLAQSGGAAQGRMTFDSSTRATPHVGDKSLGDDGIECIQRGGEYDVSYDIGSSVVSDVLVTADAVNCNGLCGPACTQLTPWQMWTLDCLEHDACCAAVGDPDLVCWTPLGECGDEYAQAEADFLRGFDPLATHCGG
jgi:hypothetical protein